MSKTSKEQQQQQQRCPFTMAMAKECSTKWRLFPLASLRDTWFLGVGWSWPRPGLKLKLKLVAHDVLPNYYNYVGKTKILINDNFFVVSASQLIKSITHNVTGERGKEEGERVCGSKCCQGNFVIKVYNVMRRMAPFRSWSRLQHKYVNRYPN